MLDELRVTNFGVITGAGIEPGAGFVVVTGETGAGKTLLLGALRALTGGPARRDQIGPAGDEAVVSGRFLLDGDLELVASRRIVASGRSRSYLDGEIAPLKELQRRTAGLVEIVGQHDHLTLQQQAGVRRLVDGALDAAGREALEAYRTAWEEHRDLVEMQHSLGGDRRALERELETVRHQAEEIAAAGFAPGDDASLQERAERLRNAGAIVAELQAAANAVDDADGASERLATAVTALRRAARLGPGLESLAGQADEAAGLLAELAAEIARAGADLEQHPDELETVEQRLALLGDLRRKYGASLADVLEFGAAAQSRFEELELLLERAESLEKEIAASQQRVLACGERLHVEREAAAQRVEKEATTHLRDLGFAAPIVAIDVAAVEPGPQGTDRIELAFASDESLRPGPVSRVASGGELSRLVLALRLAGGVTDAPVVAFDEVDAGIGGATALAMGKKLASLAQGRQVLCVTHLPQVAAFADQHLVVNRDGAHASVHQADSEERVRELTRMLSGLPESERGREHAAELLALAGGRR